MRVDVYRNLNKQCWSVRSMETGAKHRSNYGKVIDHVHEATLYNCSFIVGKKGRQRVIDTRRKNVHAFVRGNSVLPFYLPKKEKLKRPLAFLGEVSYNPYMAGYFFTSDGKEIKEARMVKFIKDKVYAYN